MRKLLPCRLFDAQIAERWKLAAALAHEQHRLEDEKKAKADEYKDRIDGIKSRLAATLTEIREEAELVEVECVDRVDVKRNIKETIRTDTGLVIETAALTAEERQGELFLVEGGKPAVDEDFEQTAARG